MEKVTFRGKPWKLNQVTMPERDWSCHQKLATAGHCCDLMLEGTKAKMVSPKPRSWHNPVESNTMVGLSYLSLAKPNWRLADQ